MRTRNIVLIWFIIVQIHNSFAGKYMLNVCVLLEMTQYRYSKYYAFFNDIIQHAFQEIENRTDILQYSLQLTPKDTQVMKLSF